MKGVNKMARELKRLNINMPVELVARIDDYADKLSINRSAAVNVLVSMALDSHKAVVVLEDTIKAINGGQVDSKAL